MISIVIPLYNEEHRFPLYFHILYHYIEKNFEQEGYEIICVNDGSTDKTSAIVKHETQPLKHVKLIDLRKNMGKGFALKKGILHATGDFIFFTDIDLSADIKALPKLVTKLKDTCDIAITSRRLKKSNLAVRQHIVRETMGRGFTFMTNAILGLAYVDMTCGLKGGKRKHLQNVFRLMKINRWSFDPEMLYIATKLGYNIGEFPIKWVNNDQSKVNILKDTINSLVEVVSIRINDLRGEYKR